MHDWYFTEMDHPTDTTFATSSCANCSKRVAVTLFIPGHASINSFRSENIWASEIKWWTWVTPESVRGPKNWLKLWLSTFRGLWSRLSSQLSSFGYTAGLLMMIGMGEYFGRFWGENEWDRDCEWERECLYDRLWFLMSSRSNSSLVDIEEVAEVEGGFDCLADALTDGRCSIRKDPGGVSRVAWPATYNKSDSTACMKIRAQTIIVDHIPRSLCDRALWSVSDAG